MARYAQVPVYHERAARINSLTITVRESSLVQPYALWSTPLHNLCSIPLFEATLNMNYTSPYTIRQTMSNRRVVTYPYTIRRNMLNRRVVSSPVTSPYTIRQTTLNRRVVTAVWVLLVFAAGYFCSKSSFNAADYRGLERPAGSAVLDTWVPGTLLQVHIVS